MSSSEHRNHDTGAAGCSQQEQDLTAHYQKMFEDSQPPEQRGSDGDDRASGDEHMEEEEEMVDAEERRARGDETTDSGAGGGSETSSQAKRRRERRPNQDGTERQKFTVVDSDGVLQEPKVRAKGYGLQLVFSRPFSTSHAIKSGIDFSDLQVAMIR